MRHGRVPLAVLATCACALAAAVAARADVWQVRIVPADQTRAKGIVLRLADLGPGWTGGPQQATLSDEICPGYPAYHPKQSDLVVTGGAYSVFNSSGAYVDDQVVFLRTARMVALDWKRSIGSPSLIGCLRSSIGDFAGTSAKVLSVTRTSFPPLGRHSAAFRAVLQQHAAGAAKRFILDFVAVVQGRAELSISQITPYGRRATAQALEVKVAKTLLRRLG